MFFHWIDSLSKFQVLKVDLDVVRSVCELTKNKWPYTYNLVKWGLFFIDRICDLLSILVSILYIYDLNLHWWGYLLLICGIICRVISLVLYFCSATVCSTVLSLVSVLAILTSGLPETSVILSVCAICVLWALYLFPIVFAFIKLMIVDDDPFQFLSEMKSNRWFIRFHIMRNYFMFCDRIYDIFATFIFVRYYYHSIPHWGICFLFTSFCVWFPPHCATTPNGGNVTQFELLVH